jgi:hypothetical protein
LCFFRFLGTIFFQYISQSRSPSMPVRRFPPLTLYISSILKPNLPNHSFLMLRCSPSLMPILVNEVSQFASMDHSPINQNFELNKSRQKFHHSLIIYKISSHADNIALRSLDNNKLKLHGNDLHSNTLHRWVALLLLIFILCYSLPLISSSWRLPNGYWRHFGAVRVFI